MPTGQARTPEPPLPPAPAKDPSSPAPTHRRHRTFSSSSSSSSSTSSLSTISSTASSPSPSPSPRGGRGATSVPFSWEHHPGIPKTRLPANANKVASSSSPPAPAPPLPLPPPLRAPPPSRPRHHHQHQTRRRSASRIQPPAAGADPFAAALAECTRDERAAGAGADDDSDRRLMDSLFPSPAASARTSSSSCAPGSRRWSSIVSAGGVAGLLDMYGCKSVMGVADPGAFVVVRRPVAVVARPAGPAGRAVLLGRAGRR